METHARMHRLRTVQVMKRLKKYRPGPQRVAQATRILITLGRAAQAVDRLLDLMHELPW